MSKVRALHECFVGTTSGPVRLHADQEYDADSPLVRARPDLFTEPPADAASAPRRPILKARDKPDA